MDASGRIYSAPEDEIPAEDRARLTSSLADRLRQRRAELELQRDPEMIGYAEQRELAARELRRHRYQDERLV